MKLRRRSSLAEVAAEVAKALESAGIEAVLTGGACATLYSKGEYQSYDLDFILQSAVKQGQLDAAMKTIGFRRRGDRYDHPETPFFVEFPRGPLGIGADIAIRPIKRKMGAVHVKLLSPTDSCRDRLAAFYHWKDRQSLKAAVQIARYHKVDLRLIREWSSREGASDDCAEFLLVLKSRKTGGRAPGRAARSGESTKRR